MKERFPKNYHKPTGRILRFIVEFFIRYDWAYQMGFIDGAEKKRYFEGYADGTTDTHKFYAKEVLHKLKLK